MESHILSTKSPNHFLKIILTLIVFVYVIRADSNTDFIEKSCNVTTYPTLCVKTLASYASSVETNPLKLCNVALNVAIQAAGNCSARVSKLASQRNLASSDVSEIKDCVGDMKDAVDELKQTMNSMGHLKDSDREFQWSNAKTEASAAITDAETCVDDFSGTKVSPAVKKKIKSCVSLVVPLISNALALINHLF